MEGHVASFSNIHFINTSDLLVSICLTIPSFNFSMGLGLKWGYEKVDAILGAHSNISAFWALFWKQESGTNSFCSRFVKLSSLILGAYPWRERQLGLDIRRIWTISPQSIWTHVGRAVWDLEILSLGWTWWGGIRGIRSEVITRPRSTTSLWPQRCSDPHDLMWSLKASGSVAVVEFRGYFRTEIRPFLCKPSTCSWVMQGSGVP